MKKSLKIFKITILSLLVLWSFCSAAELPDYIPENLKPWSKWVLHGKTKSVECIPHFNDSQSVQCAFLSSTSFNLNRSGGEFKQQWQIYHETYAPLPGSVSNWPQNVIVNEYGTEQSLAAVIIQQSDNYGNSIPAIKLLPGRYTITGRFVWNSLPEYVQIPPESAIVNLSVDNLAVPFPNFDDSGRLWIKGSTKAVEQKEENRLKVEIFRLIDDTIPAQITIHATVDVAGAAREVKLGPIYPPAEFIPMSLDTELPSKLESDGTIQIQVKPGRYTMTIKLRHIGTLKSLLFQPAGDGTMPEQEIWSLHRRTNLRIVEISGVSAVDPRMTSMPEEWKSYPAYIMRSKQIMHFKEIKRGDPNPPPDQLNLHKTLWLAFDGSGYTVQDRISGNKNSGWRLEIEPLMQPGKVTVDGVEQLITTIEPSKADESKSKSNNSNFNNNHNNDDDKSYILKNSGVELRRRILDLVADSRILSSIYTIPATGWIHPFQKVTGTLNLPPGWKLIAAQGVDNISGTWVKRWSLLDIFIVLIFTIATAKLFSFPLSIVGFITLTILYHEQNAPRYVWIFLLLGFVMLNLTKNRTGRLRDAVKFYQFLISISLLLISIPYAIESLRIGIYPQLENSWISMNDTVQQPTAFAPMLQQTMDKMESEMVQPEVQIKGGIGVGSNYLRSKRRLLEAQSGDLSYSQSDENELSKVMQYDPKSMTQTGPGLPLWQPFRTINFSWSGPVEKGHTLSFILIGPTFNLILSFVRVAFIILLAIGMFRAAGFLQKKLTITPVQTLILTLISVSIFTILTPNLTTAGEIPSAQILEELQKRLLEKDDCFPACADISQMEISIKDSQIERQEEIEITLNIDAAVDTTIPLPGHSHHWLPEYVLINGKDADGLFRYGQTIWAMVSKGKNIVVIKGKIGNQSTFQIPLNLKPHSGKILNSNGWEISGIQPDNTLDDQLQFKRTAIKNYKELGKQGAAGSEEEDQKILETAVLPPFVVVERNILLGLDWKVETKVERLTPTGSAIVLKLPLLDGESVVSQGIRSRNGIVEITLNSDQTSLSFESFLPLSDKIRLYHALFSDNDINPTVQSTAQQDTREERETSEQTQQNLQWTEIWRLDASPIFHVETEGIPVILHQKHQRWYPTWHPLPGEEVILNISRPKGVEGQTITIEKSTLELYPGHITTRSILKLSIKSSQGGQHAVTIPEKAELQEVKINGELQLIRQDGQKVVLPIAPGSQNIELIWKDKNSIKTLYRTPKIDLGIPSVNAAIDINISSDRWTLFVGGEQLMSPAVLFWSKIIVVLIISIGLAMTGLTPLNFYQWFLLGIGMSMSSAAACIFVAAWLVVLDMRKRWGKGLTIFQFNLMQTSIVLLTAAAIMSLLFAISQGLLGHPSMNITGNGSSASLLRWYQDISGSTLPAAWFLSLPMFAYRIAMLMWALWLSFWLISILKWGWSNFSSTMIWAKATASETDSDTKSNLSDSGEDTDQSTMETKTEDKPHKTKKRGCCSSIKKLFKLGGR